MNKKQTITWGVRLGSMSLVVGLAAVMSIETQQKGASANTDTQRQLGISSHTDMPQQETSNNTGAQQQQRNSEIHPSATAQQSHSAVPQVRQTGSIQTQQQSVSKPHQNAQAPSSTSSITNSQSGTSRYRVSVPHQSRISHTTTGGS